MSHRYSDFQRHTLRHKSSCLRSGNLAQVQPPNYHAILLFWYILLFWEIHSLNFCRLKNNNLRGVNGINQTSQKICNILYKNVVMHEWIQGINKHEKVQIPHMHMDHTQGKKEIGRIYSKKDSLFQFCLFFPKFW